MERNPLTLAVTRAKRTETRELLACGMDPSGRQKGDKLAAAQAAQNTCGAVAAEHLQNLTASGTAPTTMSENRWMLQVLAAPLTHRSIGEIAPTEVLDVSQSH